MDDKPAPPGDYRGGAYSEIHKLPHKVPGRPAGDPGLHCHHLIAKKALVEAGMDAGRAPSIQVEFPHHTNTATFGTSPAAKRAHALMARMLKAGDLDGAMQFGLDDVRSKPFGPRYERALQQAERYYREGYRLPTLLELDARRQEQGLTTTPRVEPDQERQPPRDPETSRSPTAEGGDGGVGALPVLSRRRPDAVIDAYAALEDVDPISEDAAEELQEQRKTEGELNPTQCLALKRYEFERLEPGFAARSPEAVESAQSLANRAYELQAMFEDDSSVRNRTVALAWLSREEVRGGERTRSLVAACSGDDWNEDHHRSAARELGAEVVPDVERHEDAEQAIIRYASSGSWNVDAIGASREIPRPVQQQIADTMPSAILGSAEKDLRLTSPSSLATLRQETLGWFRRHARDAQEGSASDDDWPSRGPVRDPGREL